MKKYIIFGAGRYGEEALFYYGIKNIAYFCDNRKFGGMIRGIEIIAFDQLSNIWEDYVVILAVSIYKYRKEMQDQLEEKGITYQIFRSIEGKLAEDNFTGEYEFVDRSRAKEKLLIVLAGYKDYLWDSVFSRVRKYVSEDTDICVMTAGYSNDHLQKICEEEGWSYLFTYENKLSLTQNLAIKVHPTAKWIYKMDEDIFITPGLFEELLSTYEFVKSEKKYETGIVAPVMAVNSYGYRRVLEYEDKVEEYEERFGAALTGRGDVFSDQEAARYLWDLTLPVNIFAEKLKKEGIKYSICYHRFSIGCFLMTRSIWEEMGGFKIAPEGVLGIDEEHLCEWCMNHARAIIIAEQSFAGHFSYGLQTEGMKEFYESRRSEFDLL